MPENGKLTDAYYNFHSFPFNKWADGPVAGMIGAEIGMFMETVRRADLNIITAEWVGLVSRTEPPVARTRAVLVGRDPVALDFHTAKYLLYSNSKIPVHNPEDPNGPLHQYLTACAARGGGEMDESLVPVRSHDFRTGRASSDFRVIVPRYWGFHPKMLAKYLALRLSKPH